MADVTKLAARRKGFGAPPSLDEASNNLSAPETAPATPAAVEQPSPEASSATPVKAAPATKSRPAPALRAKSAAAEPLQVLPPPPAASRIDGRSMRRTNRTLTLATRVTPEFDARVRAIAQREGIMLVEVLERALDALEPRH